MSTTVINKGTFYSQVTLPDFKGLLEEILFFDYKDCSKHGQMIKLNLDVFLKGKEMLGSKEFILLKSQTQFEFLTDGTFGTDDVYVAVEQAIIALKAYPRGKEDNIEMELSRVPFLTKEQVMNDLVNFVQMVARGQCKGLVPQ